MCKSNNNTKPIKKEQAVYTRTPVSKRTTTAAAKRSVKREHEAHEDHAEDGSCCALGALDYARAHGYPHSVSITVHTRPPHALGTPYSGTWDSTCNGF